MASASVSLTPQQVAEYEASSESTRIKLLIVLAKGANPDLATTLLNNYPLQGPHAANRKLFVEGLVLRSEGNLTGAVKNFRTALADDPKLTLVRQELAQTLLSLDENDSAKHHLLLLAADAPDEAAAAGVRSFIEQIDERTPFRFGAYVSLAPSTNVNNGSAHSTVYSAGGLAGDINEEYRAKSGVGIAAGGNVGYSRRLGNDFLAVLAGGVDGRLYDDQDFNSLSASQSAELRYLLDKGYLGFGVVASEYIDTREIDVSAINYGPRMSLQYNLTEQNRLNASVLHEWRDRTHTDTGDETALIIDAALTHAIDSTASVGISAGFDSIENAYAHTSYDTWSAGLNVYKELPKGFTVNASGEARFSNFDGIYPFIGVLREDTRLVGSIELTKRDWNIFGYAPSLEYTYTNNISNISLYDYDNHAVDLRLTKEF